MRPLCLFALYVRTDQHATMVRTKKCSTARSTRSRALQATYPLNRQKARLAIGPACPVRSPCARVARHTCAGCAAAARPSSSFASRAPAAPWHRDPHCCRRRRPPHHCQRALPSAHLTRVLLRPLRSPRRLAPRSPPPPLVPSPTAIGVACTTTLLAWPQRCGSAAAPSQSI